jgi:hypothetical protein
MAGLGTVYAIARFGDAGGSIYFTPTAIHAMVLIAMLVTAVGKLGVFGG